jgi:hypothetical protein
MPSVGTDRSKELEIDRAWIQHDPERARITPAILRELRAFKRDIGITAATIEAVLKRDDLTQFLIEPLVRRRGMARRRQLEELRRTLPGAHAKISFKNILEIAWLSPTAPIIANPVGGEAQDCILACFLVAWPPTPQCLQCHRAWALEVPDHAAARLLQRAPETDLRTALFEASLAFLSADAAAVTPHVGAGSTVYIPAGLGAFACNIVGAQTADGRRYIYARAGTWITEEMRAPNQVLLPLAAAAEQTVALALWRWNEVGDAILPSVGMSLSPSRVRHSG